MILNVRVDHQTENIAQIERLTQDLDELFQIIKEKSGIDEYLYLKTCNRAEIYLVSYHLTYEDLPLDLSDFVVEIDEYALIHLLRLASGLESMIIGEDQILGQIKDVKNKGLKEGCLGPVLKTVFTKAVHVGQLVRNNTCINQGSLSIGTAAIKLAESVHGDLDYKNVLVIGAGKMGTLVAKALTEKNLRAIVVANRTYNSAVKLANELNGYAIHFDLLHEALRDVDIVISATGAPHHILTYKDIKEAIPHENLSHVVMVDIANPRDIDENVKNLGVKLFNIDDLRSIADENLKMRKLAVDDAEKIIEKELLLLEKSLKHLNVEPIISNIRANAEEVRKKEIIKAFKMLGDINGKEKIVDDLTSVIVERLFYNVIKNIREAAEEDDATVLKAAEIIFLNNK